MSKYVTTAISYVNGPPHLGHAYELIYADAIARAERRLGADVRFVTGTDENSLKNVRAAEEEGIETRALVDRNALRFAALAGRLRISHDDFIRTTEPRHAAGVSRLWSACAANGDFYRAAYRGLYCVGCEQFWAPEDLAEGGLCPEHGRAPEPVEEENVFFRLSRYQRAIEAAIEGGTLIITPSKARAEALAFVRRGLVDFSVSRSRARARGWGIPVPDDPDQIIYVWFDALANYLTALGFGGSAPARLFDRYWSESTERVHVIGKGITRFHAVYWPGILASAGLPFPTRLVVHGYLTVGGRKIGKSLGNAVDPGALADSFGADVLRYWLLRHVRASEDADFSVERLVRARDVELADQLGNLLSRSARLIARAVGGNPPADPGADGTALLDRARDLEQTALRSIAEHRPDLALDEIFEVVGAANRFVEETAPWKLLRPNASDPSSVRRLGSVLGSLARVLRAIGRALSPLLPGTALELERRLGDGRDPVREGPPLFPKQTYGSGNFPSSH